MVSVLDSSAEDHWFEPWLGPTKDYKIDICYFSTKHAALRSKSKDWLGQYQDNVFEWSDMSTCVTVASVSQHYKNPTKSVGLVQSRHDHLIDM